MQLDCSLCSQDSTACPCREPHESSVCQTPSYFMSILLFSHLRLGFANILCAAFHISVMRATYHSLDLKNMLQVRR
jgi:hypothetical protein